MKDMRLLRMAWPDCLGLLANLKNALAQRGKGVRDNFEAGLVSPFLKRQ